MVTVTVRAPMIAVEWAAMLLNAVGAQTTTREAVGVPSAKASDLFPRVGKEPEEANQPDRGFAAAIRDDETREVLELLNEMHGAVLEWAAGRTADPMSDGDFLTLLAYGVPPVWIVDATLEVDTSDKVAIRLAGQLARSLSVAPTTRLLFPRMVLPLLDRIEEAARDAASQGN